MSENSYVIFKKKDLVFQGYLFISSLLFIIPTILALYFKNIRIFLMSLSMTITSLLRWGYRENTLYQYIDHNFVKLIFFYELLNVTIATDLYDIYYLTFDHNKEIKNTLVMYCLLNIALFFVVSVVFHYIFHSHLNVIFHMIMHVYVVFSSILSLVF